MNTGNIKAADRPKVIALIVLILLVIAFVAHMMMGAVSPASKSAVKPGAAPVAAASTPAVPPGVAQGAPVAAGTSVFPTDKVDAAAGAVEDKRIEQALHDPFEPLPGSAVSAPSTPRRPAVSVTPASQPRAAFLPRAASMPPTGFGGAGAGLPLLGAAGASLAVVPREPEIQVIGLVAGPPSVATVRIDGRTVIARPGDLLARGYRVLNVDADGIRVNAHNRLLWLRVGAILNEQSKKPTGLQQQQQH